MTATERLKDLGIDLPAVATPGGSYVPARKAGEFVFTAGQLPIVDGALANTGKVGADISVDEGRRLARICTLNALAAVDSVVGLDQVAAIVKVVGFVSSAPGFGGQPKVVDGASELLGEVFEEAGLHARSAVGMAELPMDAPVEIELVVLVR